MGTPRPRARAHGPTRRKVLVTALAAAAGVTGSRMLGLRDLGNGRVAQAMAPVAMDPDVAMVTELVPDEAVADDSFFGAQELDASAFPEPLRPSVTGTLQPPVSGITPPRMAGDLDWVSPLGSERGRVMHLLRRTTFGYSDAELERALSDGYARTVERILDTPFSEPPPYGERRDVRPSPSPSPAMSQRASAAPSAMPSPSMPSAAATMAADRSMAPAATPRGTAMPSATASAAPRTSPAPMTNRTQINIAALQTWWLDWMLRTETPFAEKMTLFWHGHFTSDYRKVGTGSPAMYWQNLTWRRMALGDLKSMLLQVTPDLAMLRYLDLAVSTGRAPNENYARELLELFTMGAGTFTEDDVKAAAKALAGWRLPGRNEPTARTGIFDQRRAFAGTLTFLGKTGRFDTAAVVDQILAQDVTARSITRELVQHFVSPGATDAYVARLADRFRRSGHSVKALLRDIFLSPEFVSQDAYRALIKSPTEFMVGTAKALGPTSPTRTMREFATALGQNLFDPPSVAGWGDHASWISSNTMLQRANFVSSVLGQVRTPPPSANAHERLLDGVLGPGTVEELNRARTERSRWFAVLVSPEFQLK